MLPLKEMAEELASHLPKKHPQGKKPMFPAEGEIALMFLKPYTGQSDDGLVEMLNGSIHMQMFCGVLIDPSRPIKDGKIVSAIRNRVAPALDIVRQQSVLYKKWETLLKDKDLCMSDATCYESHLRYPTDIKLLWECCEWLYGLLHKTCRSLGERLPRSKYRDIDKARLAYAKQRKPKKSATRKPQRRLLGLLGKLIDLWNRLCRQYAPPAAYSAICVPRSGRAASEIKNSIMAWDASPPETDTARLCCYSSAYTWQMPRPLPPGSSPLKYNPKKRNEPDPRCTPSVFFRLRRGLH